MLDREEGSRAGRNRLVFSPIPTKASHLAKFPAPSMQLENSISRRPARHGVGLPAAGVSYHFLSQPHFFVFALMAASQATDMHDIESEKSFTGAGSLDASSGRGNSILL
jgi:hypothetical protein